MMKPGFQRYLFGDAEFWVPERYVELEPKGGGAQGLVWWVRGKKEETLRKTFPFDRLYPLCNEESKIRTFY